MTRSILTSLSLCLALTGCVGMPMPGGVGGGGTGGGGALMCRDLGAGADAQKVEAFLVTGARFEANALALAADVEATCESMAADLGVTPPSAVDGQMQVEASCRAVAEEIRARVDAALPQDASLYLEYEPAVCSVDVDAYAGCVAECDATFVAESDVECTEGRLVGQCSGTCSGECRVDGTAYEVNGACAGECVGSCSVDFVEPRCEGDVYVEADAQCEAACEARVDVVAECSEPSLYVSWDSGVDPAAAAELDELAMVLEDHYPHLLALQARLEAVADSGAELVTSFEGAADAAGRIGVRAGACFAESTLVAAESVMTIDVTLSVTVEVSASASASASAG